MNKSTLPDSDVLASKSATRKAIAEQHRLIRMEEVDHFDRTRIGDRIKPTRQTEQRLRRCPIETLLESGSLSREQGQAAREIHEVYVAILGNLLSHAALSERKERGKGSMAEHLADKHANHYLPWAIHLGGKAPFLNQPAIVAKCQPALELTIDVVIDGATLAECATKFHCHHDYAKQMLRYALAVYADIAGWEQSKHLIGSFEEDWRNKGKRRRAA